jgi:hypothetical protein
MILICPVSVISKLLICSTRLQTYVYMATSIHLIILKISNMPCCRKFQASDMLYERIDLRGNFYPSFLIVKPRWSFSAITSIHHCNQDEVKHIATNTKRGTYAAHRCDHQLHAQQRARTVLVSSSRNYYHELRASPAVLPKTDYLFLCLDSHLFLEQLQQSLQQSPNTTPKISWYLGGSISLSRFIKGVAAAVP